MQIIDEQGSTNAFPLAIVVSRFNDSVTRALYEGALQRLNELDFSDHQVTVVWVPGAVEIPITAQRLAATATYEAIITLGAVIRGETSHYDYVCEQVSQGCQQVALAHNIPVIFGVLTTETDEQAIERSGGGKGNKGREAVDAAMEMVAVLRAVE
jgi:6,7-dimethyl-8-ribityllumazine synthase